MNRSETVHKTFVKKEVNPPSPSPSPERDDDSAEKLYISLLEGERQKDALVDVGEHSEPILEKREERESHEIYKSCNSVIPRKRRYRKNTVRARCQHFAQDFYDHGFNEGVKLSKHDLRYWIIALDLAHDKMTVSQYLERLVMYGYFYIHNNGFYEFVRVRPKGQLTLLDPKIVRRKLEASLRPLRRTRRSY